MSFRLVSTFCPLSVKTYRSGWYGCFVRPLGGGGGAKRGRKGTPALLLLTFGVSVFVYFTFEYSISLYIAIVFIYFSPLFWGNSNLIDF